MILTNAYTPWPHAHHPQGSPCPLHSMQPPALDCCGLPLGLTWREGHALSMHTHTRACCEHLPWLTCRAWSSAPLLCFGHPMWTVDSLEKTLMLAKTGGRRQWEDEVVGWHHQLNGHEFEETRGDSEGQGSLAHCSPWGQRKPDTTEWLNNNGRIYCCATGWTRHSSHSFTCWRTFGFFQLLDITNNAAMDSHRSFRWWRLSFLSGKYLEVEFLDHLWGIH